MNEDLKNIETCLPESILAEVASVPTDAQFRSLTDEALDPLKQQAFQQAGSDAYNEVVAQHKPYTFTSQVKQMKSNLILLLRRLWRFPFGTGTLRSLSDMWSHYITRLQGNETYGIPSRLDQLTDLPSAPLLVADRKISGADVPDGMSMGRILCDSSVSAAITEIDDTTTGWTMDNFSLLSAFPNANKLRLLCKRIYTDRGFNTAPLISGFAYTDIDMSEVEDIAIIGGNRAAVSVFANMDDLTTVHLDMLKRMDGGLFDNCDSLTEIDIPTLKEIGTNVAKNCDNLERVVCDGLERVNGYANVVSLIGNLPKLRFASFKSLNYYSIYLAGNGGGSLQNMPLLEELHIGKVAFTNSAAWYCAALSGCGSLIKLVIYGDLNQSIYLNSWSPTLDSSNLQQFLSNFREYIALRLKGFPIGQGPTLTLSQAVFSEIWDSQGQPQVKGDGLDQLRADIHRIIRTDKQWAVNKA